MGRLPPAGILETRAARSETRACASSNRRCRESSPRWKRAACECGRVLDEGVKLGARLLLLQLRLFEIPSRRDHVDEMPLSRQCSREELRDVGVEVVGVNVCPLRAGLGGGVLAEVARDPRPVGALAVNDLQRPPAAVAARESL